MRRVLLPILLVVPLTLFGQTAPEAIAPQTLRVGKQLVIVDVTVTGAGGPVRHLTAKNLAVLENGTPQTIERFEEHVAPAGIAKLSKLPAMPPGIYTNFSPAPEDGPLNILLVDTLNTPMQSQMVARQKIMMFLQTMKPTQRVAVFGLSTRLFLLQGFTSDPALLQAAIAGKHGNVKTSALLGDSLGSQTIADQVAAATGNSPADAELRANVQQFEATIASAQTRDRVLTTLSAMNQVARYVSGLPGRKNLIWISGSFPLNILPDPKLKNPFSVGESMEDEFRETTNLLTRAQVAVYPIDARGLFPPPMTDASISGGRYARNPTAMNRDLQTFSDNTFNEHATMQEMAESTGGAAYVNTNDLNGALNSALSAGSDYYTLVYSPTNRNWDGHFRKIVVQADNKSYTLTYRRGYYAEDPTRQRTQHDSKAATTAADASVDPMTAAMQRGAPDLAQIMFKAKIVPVNGLQEKIAEGNVAAGKTKGPYRLFSVNLACNPQDLDFHVAPDGKRTSAVRFTTIVYDRDGQPVTLMSNAAQASLAAAGYQEIQKTGVQYSEQISVPAKGEYFLRIGMEDLHTGKVGTIEVPTDAVPTGK
jgi:VWFA-related protein